MALPDGWTVVKLGDLLDFKNGVNTDAKNYGSGIKFVNVLDIFAGHTITQDSIKGSVQIDPKQIAAYGLRRGDILFNRTSETHDEIAFSSVYSDDRPAVFGGFVIRGRPKSSHLHPTFTKYCFQSAAVRREFVRRCQGAIRGNIGQTDLRKVPLLLPPFDEQRKIGSILSTWDRAIETVEKLIGNSELQKHSLMQRLLQQEAGTLASAPKWVPRKLGELFTERSETNRSALPLLSITGKQGVIPQDSVGRKNTAARDKSKYKRLCPNDIGYNTMRMWQGVSALSALEGIVSPAYTVVTSKGEIDPVFASYLFKLPRTVHNFRRYSQGLTSDTWNLKFPLFAEIEVLLPSLDEQHFIAGVLSTADREIDALCQHLSALRQEKKALMRQLLTGKRRVQVVEEVPS